MFVIYSFNYFIFNKSLLPHLIMSYFSPQSISFWLMTFCIEGYIFSSQKWLKERRESCLCWHAMCQKSLEKAE